MKKIIINQDKKEKEQGRKIINQRRKYKVELASEINNEENIITITKDNQPLKMNFLGKRRKHKIIKVKGKQEANKIIYSGIEEGIDLEYLCEENKIKENLIIKTKQENYEYDFNIDIGELKPVFNDKENTLELQKEGRSLYQILSPYMEDSNGNQSKECSYEIEQEGQILTLHLHCDNKWINEQGRAFPIVVDPTIEINKEAKKKEEKQYYKIGQEGTVKINLNDLSYGYDQEDNIFIQEKELTLSLKHIYDCLEEKNKGIGKGWSSNIHQTIDKSKEYDEGKGYKEIIYKDGENEQHILKEYWYYEDENEQKVNINRNKVYIDIDQKLKYEKDEQHIYEVKNEIKSDEKITYISGMNLTSYEAKKKEKKHYYIKYGFGKREIDIRNIAQNLQFYYYDSQTNKKIYLKPEDVKESEEGYYCNNEGKLASIELGYSNIISKNSEGIYTYKYLQTDENTKKTIVKSDGVVICEEEKEEKVKVEDIYRNEEIKNIDNQIIDTKRYVEEQEAIKVRAKDTYKALLKQLEEQVSNYNIKEKIKEKEIVLENTQEEQKQIRENFFTNIGNHCLELSGECDGLDKETLEYKKLINDVHYIDADQILISGNSLLQLKMNIAQSKEEYKEAERGYKEERKQLQQKQDKEALASIVEQLKIYEKEIGRININLEENQQLLNSLKKQREVLIDDQRKKINDFIIDIEGNTLGFDGYGRLILIQDKYENKINIEFGNTNEDKDKILSIYSEKQSIRFKYEEDTGLLKSIIDPQGRETKYNYDTNNDLISIVSANGKKIKFDYTNGIKVTTPLLESIEIIKNNNGSINVRRYCLDGNIDENTKIAEEAEQTLISNETYSYRDTISKELEVIDNLYNVNNKKYYFDEEGRIIKEETKKVSIYKEYQKDKIILESIEEKKHEPLLDINSNAIVGTTKTYYIEDISDKISNHDYLGLKVKLNQIPVPQFEIFVGVNQEGEEQNEYKKQINEGSKDGFYILGIKVKKEKPLSLIVACSDKNNLLESSMIESMQVIILNDYKVFSYNQNKELIKEENKEGIIEYLDYDENGRYHQTKETNIYNEEVITKYQYNERNQLTYKEDNKGNVEEYTYDEKGNIIERRKYNKKDASLIKVEKITNEEKQENIKYQYDNNTGELLSIVTSVNGINNSTSFTYNYGLLTSMTHHGMKVNYEYDGQGRKTKISLNGEDVIYNTYEDNFEGVYEDIFNNNIETSFNGSYLKSITSEGLIEERYVDSSGRQILNKYTSNDNDGTIKYSYNNKDLINDVVSEIIYHGSNETYKEETLNEYDEYDFLTKQEKKINNQKELILKNQYDNKHRITSYEVDSSKANYYLKAINTYNEAQQITKINYSERTGQRGYYATYEMTYDYDVLGRIKHQNIHDNKIDICHEYSYLQQDENTLDLISEDITKIKITQGSQTTYLSETTTYQYDVNGNITSINTDESNINYQYDSLNRLIREDNPTINKTINYQYDKAGNILLKRITEYTTEEKIISPTVKEYVYDCEKADQLISYDNKQIKYDTMGRPIIYKDDEYNWNDQGQLTSILTQDGDEIEYYYDINGIRRKKIVNGVETTYITNGSQILIIKQGNETIYFRYGLNKVIGFNYNNGSSSKEYIYQRNIQGDIISIYDDKGNEVGGYSYDAYGNVIITKDTDGIATLNPFRYRGYYYDNETDLYYLNSRYYDPDTGRFISPDILSILDISKSHINGLNLYLYCRDNPVMFIDTSGYLAITLTTLLIGGLIAGAIGAGIGLGTAIYKDVKEDEVWFNGDWTDYVGRTLGGFIAGFGIGICTILGAGVGGALSTGTALTIGETTISGGVALAIGVGEAFITGGLGYSVRTGISNQEEFEWSDMFIEAGVNAINGMITFTGAVVGGIIGIKVPGTKFSFKNFVLYHLGSAYFGVYPTKIILAYIKKKLKEMY